VRIFCLQADAQRCGQTGQLEAYTITSVSIGFQSSGKNHTLVFYGHDCLRSAQKIINRLEFNSAIALIWGDGPERLIYDRCYALRDDYTVSARVTAGKQDFGKVKISLGKGPASGMITSKPTMEAVAAKCGDFKVLRHIFANNFRLYNDHMIYLDKIAYVTKQVNKIGNVAFTNYDAFVDIVQDMKDQGVINDEQIVNDENGYRVGVCDENPRRL